MRFYRGNLLCQWGFTSVTDHWLEVPHVAPFQEQQSMKRNIKKRFPHLPWGLKINKRLILALTTVIYVLFELLAYFTSRGY